MNLRHLMDEHRVQNKHLLKFLWDHNLEISRPHLSRVLSKQRTMQPKVRAMIRAAMIQFGALQHEIDACPELNP